jgi:hypothetical protein
VPWDSPRLFAVQPNIVTVTMSWSGRAGWALHVCAAYGTPEGDLDLATEDYSGLSREEAIDVAMASFSDPPAERASRR